MDEDNYTSPYIKSEYTGIICFKNPSTGETEHREIKRSIYRNAKIDPDLLIPAGTVIGNETTSQDMTNMERMSKGKSPVILSYDEKGNPLYDRVELHHLTSTERNRGSVYFNGEERDGSLVEIQSSLHDKYTKPLHAINESDNSFRKTNTVETDESGNTIRHKTKTADATQYDKFRSQYWKDRAEEIIQQRKYETSEDSSVETNKENGGNNMAKSWELTPEEKQKAIQGQQKAAEKWSKKTSTSSGADEGKGERERERTRDKGQTR